jgi:hypothetical protein
LQLANVTLQTPDVGLQSAVLRRPHRSVSRHLTGA